MKKTIAMFVLVFFVLSLVPAFSADCGSCPKSKTVKVSAVCPIMGGAAKCNVKSASKTCPVGKAACKNGKCCANCKDCKKPCCAKCKTKGSCKGCKCRVKKPDAKPAKK